MDSVIIGISICSLVIIILLFFFFATEEHYLSDMIKYSKVQDVLDNDENNLLRILSLHFGKLMLSIAKSSAPYYNIESIGLRTIEQDGIVYITYTYNGKLYNLTIDCNSDECIIKSTNNKNGDIIHSIKKICNYIIYDYIHKNNSKDDTFIQQYQLALSIIFYTNQLDGIIRISTNNSNNYYSWNNRV